MSSERETNKSTIYRNSSNPEKNKMSNPWKLWAISWKTTKQNCLKNSIWRIQRYRSLEGKWQPRGRNRRKIWNKIWEGHRLILRESDLSGSTLLINLRQRMARSKKIGKTKRENTKMRNRDSTIRSPNWKNKSKIWRINWASTMILNCWKSSNKWTRMLNTSQIIKMESPSWIDKFANHLSNCNKKTHKSMLSSSSSTFSKVNLKNKST